MPHVKRYPNNPLLKPNPAEAWEAEAAFNGSISRYDGSVHIVYRAESAPQNVNGVLMPLAVVGHAHSSDGVRFHGRRPAIVPEFDWERYGCEDPRITHFEGNNYIFYTALSRHPFGADGIKVALAKTKDFKTFEKHPVTPFNAKAMALFPYRINGKMAAILTANTDKPPSKIGIALFDNEEDIWSPEYWDKWYSNLETHSLNLRRNDNDHVEVGAAPILTKDGWLLVYSHIRNYFRGERSFGIEAVLLDLDDPTKIISRTTCPLVVPEEDYERRGRVGNVVFPTGAFVRFGKLHIYYGAADTTTALATCSLSDLLKEMRLSTLEFKRAKNNPIIVPVPENDWEAKATFNPAAVTLNGKVHLLYRAMSSDGVSTIGHATLKNAETVESRSQKPVYVPRETFERPAFACVGCGCEDPRLTAIGESLYMTYTAYDGKNPPRVAITSISQKNFLAKRWRWTKPVLISPAGEDDKDAVVFPKMIDGQYVILHRLGVSIWIDSMPDLEFKNGRTLEGRVLMGPRATGWDSQKIGMACPPIETKEGWLLIYHGVSDWQEQHYVVGAALLDKKDMTKIIARTSDPILVPLTSYEKNGQVPNVVFPCGSALVGDQLYLYYGGADSTVGCASMKLSDLLKRMLTDHICTDGQA